MSTIDEFLVSATVCATVQNRSRLLVCQAKSAPLLSS